MEICTAGELKQKNIKRGTVVDDYNTDIHNYIIFSLSFNPVTNICSVFIRGTQQPIVCIPANTNNGLLST